MVRVSHILSPVALAAREVDLAQIRGTLGAERFETLRAEGRALTFMQVMALALEVSGRPTPIINDIKKIDRVA